MSNRPRRVNLGFSLVELLVLLAILSVLAAVLMPVMARAREHAGASTCLSNLRQIGTAIQMYSQDYDNYMPYAPDCFTKIFEMNGGTKYFEPLGSAAKAQPDIKDILRPYGATDQVFHCPDDVADLSGHALLPTQSVLPESWFAYDGSSYNYADWVGLVPKSFSAFDRVSETYLMGDMEHFHDSDGPFIGLFNVLYMDIHVKARNTAQENDAINLTEE